MKTLKFHFAKTWPQIKIQFNQELSFSENQWCVAVMGPSGSGKTSFARWLAGLLPTAEGFLQMQDHIWFCSERNISLSPQERRVGFLAQGDLLFPHLNVEENVGYSLRHLSRAERRQRVTELLKMVGLERREKRRPATLSGGEKRRVALAQVLAREPKILILDEPLSGLDHQSKEILIQDLKKWIDTFQIPTLLITHSLEEAEVLGARVIPFCSSPLQFVATVPAYSHS